MSVGPADVHLRLLLAVVLQHPGHAEEGHRPLLHVAVPVAVLLMFWLLLLLRHLHPSACHRRHGELAAYYEVEEEAQNVDQVDATCKHNPDQGKRAGERAALEARCYRLIPEILQRPAPRPLGGPAAAGRPACNPNLGG